MVNEVLEKANNGGVFRGVHRDPSTTIQVDANEDRVRDIECGGGQDEFVEGVCVCAIVVNLYVIKQTVK